MSIVLEGQNRAVYAHAMLGDRNFDLIRQLFADRFERDGTGYLYRKSVKSARIRVTQAERDAFIESYNRRLRHLIRAMFASILLLFGLLVAFFPHSGSAYREGAMYFGLGCILLPWLVAFHWVGNAPARELARRTPVGPAPSRDELRRLMFSRLTYGQLASAALASAALLWGISTRWDVLRGWGALWLVLVTALIAGVAIQAYRKWRFERT